MITKIDIIVKFFAYFIINVWFPKIISKYTDAPCKVVVSNAGKYGKNVKCMVMKNLQTSRQCCRVVVKHP